MLDFRKIIILISTKESLKFFNIPWALHSYDGKSGFNCCSCKCIILDEFSICTCCFNKMDSFKYNRICSRNCPFCWKKIGIIRNWIAVIYGTRHHKCDFNILEVWFSLNK